MSELQQVVATVVPVEKVEQLSEKKDVAATADSQSDVEEEQTVNEIDFDEASDTENYVPKENEGAEEDAKDDDDSCSSGDEEEGVNVDIVEHGGQKFFKLKFDDIEKRRKEFEDKMKAEEDSESDDEKVDDADLESDNKETEKPSFKEYRTATIFDEDMEKEYKSDDDENFDPIYCEGTLTDIEYSDGDERDTESEPETEPLDGTHKKTGESLMCIKMIEQLQIPPRDQPCSTGEFSGTKVPDQPMECT